MKKKFYPLCLLINALMINTGFAQVSIGNIVNTYTPVIALDQTSCQNKVTVEDASTLNPGDTVLIIQMKGAIIDSTNTANFGTITEYRNAGNYEFNYVNSKTGNVVELKGNLTRLYDVPNGKVQMIRVPYYENATITSTLTALPWDGDKGGVLVLHAKDTITLNADINLSGKGFRGGSGAHGNPPLFYCYENQYYYPPNPDLASEKGEGIALVSSGKSYGKGKNANGGGSGNSHNSGGGGGSNGANGGSGGFQYEGPDCNETVPFDNRGIPGNGLTYNNTQNKIFLGGAGGAGQANNPELFFPNGGNGGGIAIIMADIIKGTNKNILSKGDSGRACMGYGVSGCHEGMGGGGAGGTVLLDAHEVIGNLTFNVSGGKGADLVTAAAYMRVGPGGGGSGGIFWTKPAGIPANVTVIKTGGLNGVTIQTANDPWGAAPGLDGISIFNLNIPIDIVCPTIPVTLTDFSASVIESKKVKLAWHTEEELGIQSYIVERYATGTPGFIPIGSVVTVNNMRSNSYSFTDVSVNPGIIYYYRLAIIENSGVKKYSATRTVKITGNDFYVSLYPNPSNGPLNLTINHFTGTADIKVLNNLGQIIIQKKMNAANTNGVVLDISKQPGGTYWISVQTDKDKAIEKLVKH